MRRLLITLPLAIASFAASAASVYAAEQTRILTTDSLESQVAYFNQMEPEAVVNLVPNAQAAAWLKDRIPLFDCPDDDVRQIYYFRWWAIRKHLLKSGDTLTFSEFINRPRPVSSALGHNLMELRWLRDPAPLEGHLNFWLRGNKGAAQPHLHKYSGWLPHAVYQRYLVTGDRAGVVARLDELIADYRLWQQEKQLPSGMYWQYDVWDAMEESISGSRTAKNVRPTINSYMYGSARALAAISRLAGKDELARGFDTEADKLRAQVLAELWDPQAKFFKVRLESGALADVREAIGFIPWYFGLVPPTGGYGEAWAQFKDPEGFKAPFGLTTAERRHRGFRTHGTGTCEWDGAVWPYATSQTLTGLAKALRDTPPAADGVTHRDYFDAFITYTRSHRYDGLPYIGEYLDEKNGQWLKYRDPRSFYYNHSTFADLLITGVVGLVPREDETVEISPLVPADAWAWFCLDRVLYRGREVAIVWDRDGSKYGRGAGLSVFANGKLIAHSAKLERLEGKLP